MGINFGFAFISALLLFGFIVLGVMRFGLLHSYSGYSSRWAKAVPISNMNLWSIITFLAAFLLAPVMIELASFSALQFLGFLTPVYLMVISLTPEWGTNKKQYIVHLIFTILCFFGGLIWLLVVMRAYLLFLVVSIIIITLALLTGSLTRSAIFWLEMIMFVSVYLVILLPVLL